MSAYVRPWMGRIVRVWPVSVDNQLFLLVEETDAVLEYVVFYHHDQGMWHIAEAFRMRGHVP